MLPVRARAARLPRKHILRISCFFLALLGVSLYGAAQSLLPDKEGGAAGRRLAATAARNMSGAIKPDTCTAHCDPWGGPLSMMGAMSGQCDCEYRLVAPDAASPWDGPNSTAVATCEYQDNKAYSCCGKLDNGGGVALCAFITLYTFLGIAIICDDYFCESLELISDKLGLSEDVAGATFMAAGSSAPELFTALVTILITGGSEGLGAIVGSAVFNIMIIVGISVMAAGNDLKIAWYPLSRDCIVYIISIVVMLLVMVDLETGEPGEVTWYEGLIMVCGYGGYIYLMVINQKIVGWLAEREERKLTGKDKVAREAAKKIMSAMGKGKGAQPVVPANALESALQGAQGAQGGGQDAGAQGPGRRRTSVEVRPEQQWMLGANSGNPLLSANNRAGWSASVEAARQKARSDIQMQVGVALKVHKAQNILMGFAKKARSSRAEGGDAAAATPAAAAPAAEEDEGPPSLKDRIVSLMSLPLELLFRFTVPDCRENEDKYMGTFVASIVWIGLLSFVMVDFASRIGCIVGIPSLLMGIIVLAAGTSVPDALSSILVAKNGQGDMAVANVLGSNVFNIFLGLGLPWFIKTLIDGKPIKLPKDEPIVISTIVLLLYVIIFICIVSSMKKPTKENPWTLTPRTGRYFIAAHGLFIIWSCLIALPSVQNPVIKI